VRVTFDETSLPSGPLHRMPTYEGASYRADAGTNHAEGDQHSDVENQSRNARAGSVRVARQAGRKHAVNAAIVIIASAAPNASGSCGLTL
jgi:hypothetical protein